MRIVYSHLSKCRGDRGSFPFRPRARARALSSPDTATGGSPHALIVSNRVDACRRVPLTLTFLTSVDGTAVVIRLYSIHFVTLQARGFPSHDVQWFRPNLVCISYALREAAQGADERWTLTALTRHASRRSALYRPQVAAAWRDPRGAWGASYFCTVNVCMSVCNVGNSTINVLWKLALFCLDLVVE